MDHQTSVEQYFNRVSAMTPSQLATHNRQDYRESSQEWPDYLDYIDEWESSFKQTLVQTRKDFIYLCLAKKHQRITCGDHYHKFSTINDPKVIYVPSPDAHLDFSSCWYKTLIDADNLLSVADVADQLPRLSNPEALIIRNITKMKLMLNENLTYDQLSFTEFKELWWSKESRSQAEKIFLHSRTRPINVLETVVAEAIKELPAPEPQWLSDTKSPALIFLNAQVAADHGLHSLLRVRKDRQIILEMINNIRSSAVPTNPRIKPTDIAHAMSKCLHCNQLDTPISSTSYPGVYYAPPGNGKTTVTNKELFIGIDTDYLISFSSYDRIIEPFLSIGIPVITNQYHLCQNASEKFHGHFASNHLRKGPDGKAYTTTKEILSAQETLGDDLLIIHSDKFLEWTILSLYRSCFFYNSSRSQLMYRKQLRIRLNPDRHKENLTTREAIHALLRWSEHGESTKHRVREKARRKLSH